MGLVSTDIIDGLIRVRLDIGARVFLAALTPQDFLSEGLPEVFRVHFVTKGAEAAYALLQTICTLKQPKVA